MLAPMSRSELFSADVSTAAALEAALSEFPDVIGGLRRVNQAAWGAVDPDLLELCRLRVAMLLGCTAELAERTAHTGVPETTVAELGNWPSSTMFDSRSRSCLAFCEQFVIDVANLSDNQAGDVREHLGNEGFANFVSALLVIEQRQRLRLAWQQVFGTPTASSKGQAHDS